MPLEAIRKASKRQLRNRAWLERTITELGLREERGGGDVGGLHVWQSPGQLAPYLIYLSEQGITSYAEIGLDHGGTFILTVEYLSRFGDLHALGIDIALQPPVLAYAEQNPCVELVEARSDDPAGIEALTRLRPDLTLIDADHTAEACGRDYEIVRDLSRLIAFHDIVEAGCPGVAEVWKTIEGDKHEWIDQPKGRVNTYGIGVVNGARRHPHEQAA